MGQGHGAVPQPGVRSARAGAKARAAGEAGSSCWVTALAAQHLSRHLPRGLAQSSSLAASR